MIFYGFYLLYLKIFFIEFVVFKNLKIISSESSNDFSFILILKILSLHKYRKTLDIHIAPDYTSNKHGMS